MDRPPEIRVVALLNGPGEGVVLERVFAGHRYQRSVPLHGLVSSTEAASILGVRLRSLYQIVEDGRLKSVRRGGRVNFRLSDLWKYRGRKRRRSSDPFLADGRDGRLWKEGEKRGKKDSTRD